jgi:hypothetical protein
MVPAITAISMDRRTAIRTTIRYRDVFPGGLCLPGIFSPELKDLPGAAHGAIP